jgi:hypothetical protein
MNPLQRFAATFERLLGHRLVALDGERISLTAKGRLCVEEISSLFRHPAIRPADEPTGLLAKHNFASTYPAAQW